MFFEAAKAFIWEELRRAELILSASDEDVLICFTLLLIADAWSLVKNARESLIAISLRNLAPACSHFTSIGSELDGEGGGSPGSRLVFPLFDGVGSLEVLPDFPFPGGSSRFFGGVSRSTGVYEMSSLSGFFVSPLLARYTTPQSMTRMITPRTGAI